MGQRWRLRLKFARLISAEFAQQQSCSPATLNCDKAFGWHGADFKDECAKTEFPP
jgi:hypothetical protein